MPRRRLDPEEEIRTFRAFWRSIGWRGPVGTKQKRIASWFYRLFRDQGPGAIFTFQEMMEGAGLNLRDVSDNQAARSYLQRNRDALMLFADYFWTHEQYQHYRQNGHSEDEIFGIMCEVMVSQSIFPVWSDRYDPGKFWKLMDLDAYIWLRENRGRAIVSEVGTKATELISLRQKFPSIGDRYEIPALPDPDHFLALPPPTPGPAGMVQCPVCGHRFANLQLWGKHCNQQHPGYCDFRDEPRSGLDALFGGGGGPPQ